MDFGLVKGFHGKEVRGWFTPQRFPVLLLVMTTPPTVFSSSFRVGIARRVPLSARLVTVGMMDRWGSLMVERWRVNWSERG